METEEDEKSVCDDCLGGDCARCEELYGSCPNPDCDPFDI